MSRAPAYASPGALRLLAAGHASVDMCQGAVPALIPFLIAQRGLSFAASTTLLVAMTTASSLLQPLFGLLADRRPSRWLLPAGLACAGAGIALAGVLDGLAPMVLAVTLSGLGVAAYHPEAARRMRAVRAERRATEMSHFALGGNVGFALAPVALTPAVLLFGIPGAAVVLAPTLACAALFARAPRAAPARGPAGAGSDGDGAPARDRWAPFAGLTAMAVPVPLLALLLVIAAPGPAIAVAALVGFATIGNFSVTVVMGQEYVPSRPALASGITLGLAIGIGGLIAAALGPLADEIGIHSVLWILAALPLPAALIAVALPPATNRSAPRVIQTAS